MSNQQIHMKTTIQSTNKYLDAYAIDQTCVPFRPDLQKSESARGYLLRVSDALGYKSPSFLTSLVGMKNNRLNQTELLPQLSQLLRIPLNELDSLYYKQEIDWSGMKIGEFRGHEICSRHFNIHFPRICPICLEENQICLAEWDLTLFTVCLKHRCTLIDTCPACQKPLSWNREKVVQCNCGFDFRRALAHSISLDLFVMTKMIHRALYRSSDMGLEMIRAMPSEDLLVLDLSSLLITIEKIGFLFRPTNSSLDMRNKRRMRLADMQEIVETAGMILLEWPDRLFDRLRTLSVTGDILGNGEVSMTSFMTKLEKQFRESFRDQKFSFLFVPFRDFLLNELQNGIAHSEQSNCDETIRSVHKLAKRIWVGNYTLNRKRNLREYKYPDKQMWRRSMGRSFRKKKPE